LHDAHIISGKVKSAIKAAKPEVQDVLVHMEPVGERGPENAAMNDRSPETAKSKSIKTETVDQVLNLAEEAAAEFGHEYIGTEHLLLGLLKSNDQLVDQVLQSMKVDKATMRSEIGRLIQSGPKMEKMRQFRVPCTPRAKSVIQFAQEEARLAARESVDGTDLLVGLLREVEGVAAQLLMNQRCRLPALREEIAKARKEVERRA
jgi:ATP-dependent Clp protease ATP-binding subunit ClpA